MSIYEIAQKAKVSPSTVSKVINGGVGVSQEVRERIQKIIQEESFVPKTSVNVINNIAVVSRGGDPTTGIFYSNFLIGLMRGVSEYAFEHNYNITLYPSVVIPKVKAQFVTFCRKQRLSGMIFGNLRRDDYFIEEIAGAIPIVTVNSHFKGEKLYSICSDDFTGMYNAVKYLYEMGHRRIAFATVGLFFDSNQEKLEGYKKAIHDLQIPLDNEYIFDSTEITPTSVCHWFERMKLAEKMPTAILTMNDEEAIRIINYLRLVGVMCPRDVSIVGYDDYDFAADVNPALTTVKQVLYEKGKLAAQIACGGPTDSFQSERDEEGRYLFKTQLVVRDSARRIDESQMG